MLEFTDQRANEETSSKVLVVDDHLLIGETIVRSLSLVGGFDVMAVTSVESAIAKINENGSFDVILLDYDLPGAEVWGGLARLIKANSGGVALFSGVAKWSVVDRAMDLGAIGFIPKTAHLKTLQHAISLIAAGEAYLPIEYMRRHRLDDDVKIGLKQIERSVLTRLCEGLTNKEIGRELDLNEVTIKMHVRSLFNKLGVSNRTQAVLAAQKQGYCE